MKYWIGGLLLVRVAVAQTVDDLFAGSAVQEFRLRIDPADWVKLREKYLDSTFYKCEFEWNGMLVKNTGVKVRGSGSRNPIKPGLSIDFTKYDANQRFLGVKSLVLRNFAQDASMLHERLTMAMFQRMGLPYERETHVKLSINGDYFGLYLLVEPIDSRFLATRFGETEGYLYEFKWLGTGYNFQWLGEDPKQYVPVLFEPKNHEDNPGAQWIVDMIRAMNLTPDAEFAATMSGYLDLGTFAAHVALEQYMSEADGILGLTGMTNFYFYRRTAGDRAFFLVWDKEETFADSEWPIWRNVEQNVLVRRALAVPEVKKRYLETMLEAATLSEWLDLEARRVYGQIRPAVLEDPNRVCVPADKIDRCSLDLFELFAEYTFHYGVNRREFVEAEIRKAGMERPEWSLEAGAVKNAASGAPRLAPGALAYIQIDLPGTDTQSAQQFPLPGEMDGVSVRILGVTAPVVSVCGAGIVVQVPWGLPCGPAWVEVRDHGQVSNRVAVEVRPSSPGIYAVTHGDGALVDEAAPAWPGEQVVIYATGLGEAAEPQKTGEAVPMDALTGLNSPLTVKVGARPAVLEWAGLTPGYAGLQQINVRLPAELPDNGWALVEIMMHEEMGVPYAMPVQ